MTGFAAPNLLLSEEQTMLSTTARDFVRERAPAGRLRALRDAKDETGYSAALWEEMAVLGWLGLQIPEQYGGLGLGFFDLSVLLEASGRELMPEPFVSTLLFGVQALLLAGTEEQKRSILPRVAAGEHVLAMVRQESGSRARAPGQPMVVKGLGDDLVISGESTQVLDGHMADTFVVCAQNDAGGQTLLLVSARSEGITTTRQFRIDGHGSAIVRFDRVRVGPRAVMGPAGEAATLVQAVLDRATIGLASQMLGAAEQAFSDTLDFLKQREQFDVPIGSFQALQHRAVSLYAELSLLRSVTLAAARAVDERPEDVARLASLAKAMASETFVHVAKEAIQMHGGIGVTDEHDIGLYLKRAQAAYVTLGEPSQHRRRWAELHGY